MTMVCKQYVTFFREAINNILHLNKGFIPFHTILKEDTSVTLLELQFYNKESHHPKVVQNNI